MLVFFSFLLVLVDVKSRLAKKRDRKVPGDPVYHQKSKREGAIGRRRMSSYHLPNPLFNLESPF